MNPKKYRKEDPISYTLGTTLTIELLKTRPEQVQTVYVHSDTDRNETYAMIESLCAEHGIALVQNNKAFNILSDKDNCFIIGEFRKFENPMEGDFPHVVLVNPSNAGNLGTIIRTAVGFGVGNLAIITPAVDIFDPKVIRASMGSFFHLHFGLFSDFSEYKKAYPKRSMYPFMLQSSQNLSETPIEGKYSLIFGNEATGLPDEYLHIGQSIRIAHSGDIDSLNLPMAVGIALYETTKETFRK